MGFDLFLPEDVEVGGFATVTLQHQVAVHLPPGVWAMITGRSSTLGTTGLMVILGIVDTGYHGELMTTVYNMKARPVTLGAGYRVSQLVLMPSVTVKQEEQAPERGESGQGSTGA